MRSVNILLIVQKMEEMEDAVRALVEGVSRLKFTAVCERCQIIRVIPGKPYTKLEKNVPWMDTVLDIGIYAENGSLIGAVEIMKQSRVCLKISSLEWFRVSVANVLKAAAQLHFNVETTDSFCRLCDLCLEKAKVVTHQCSYCTGASAICSVRPWKLCIDCKSIFVHLCQNCSNKSHLRTCYLCTPRKHTCLSKCHRGCVLELNNQPKATPVSKKISSPLNFFPATTKNLH